MDKSTREDTRSDEDRKADAWAFVIVYGALALGIALYLSGWTFDF